MRYFLVVIIFIAASCGNNNSQQPQEEVPVKAGTGEMLFKDKCAQCHKVDVDMTGPALKGSFDRWKSKTDLFNFVRNSSEVIKTNKYAQDLFKKYNETFMNAFPELTDVEIQSILDYCDNYKNPPVP